MDFCRNGSFLVILRFLGKVRLHQKKAREISYKLVSFNTLKLLIVPSFRTIRSIFMQNTSNETMRQSNQE